MVTYIPAMADSSIVEAIKLLGGIAGLGTAAFTIWDRAVRGRPRLEPHITVDPVSGWLGTEAGTVNLLIKNPGPGSIGIGTVRFGDLPRGEFDLEQDVGHDVDPGRLMPIPPNEERVFPLIWAVEPGTKGFEQPQWLTVSWRPLTASFPRVPLRLRTSLAALARLRDTEIDRVLNKR